jgi:hypothetical protein
VGATRRLTKSQEEIMSRSHSAFFTARAAAVVGAAAVAIAVPLFGASATSGADPNDAPPTTATSATTNGHGWIE